MAETTEGPLCAPFFPFRGTASNGDSFSNKRTFTNSGPVRRPCWRSTIPNPVNGLGLPLSACCQPHSPIFIVGQGACRFGLGA
jgi:hypothetical protein